MPVSMDAYCNAEILPPGTFVRAEFPSGNVYEGTVLGSDCIIECLCIQSKPTESSPKGDFHILYLTHLKDIQVLKGADAAYSSPPIPLIPGEQIRQVIARATQERRRRIARRGINVSAMAQALFDHLSKTIDEVEWFNQSIVVLNRIRIEPPYTADHCSSDPAGNAGKDPLEYVVKLVTRFHESQNRSGGVTANGH